MWRRVAARAVPVVALVLLVVAIVSALLLRRWAGVVLLVVALPAGLLLVGLGLLRLFQLVRISSAMLPVAEVVEAALVPEEQRQRRREALARVSEEDESPEEPVSDAYGRRSGAWKPAQVDHAQSKEDLRGTPADWHVEVEGRADLERWEKRSWP
jgi:hypothetical protein